MFLGLLRGLCWLLFLPLPFAGGCSDAGAGAEYLPSESAVDRPPFPGEQAYRLLEEQVAFGPRVPGQAGYYRQLDWMRAWLAERADTLVEQPFTVTTTGGETLELTNLFARFQPERADRVLLVAHWDTRPRSDQASGPEEREQPVPGANDGASGTAILMQLAEMFRTDPPPVGVDLLFVDGEDYGPGSDDMYLGAKYFAANRPAGYQPLYGVLLDMVGDADLHLPVEGNSNQLAPEVVQRVWSVARDLGYDSIFTPDVGPWVTDDHLPLNEVGIRTIDIIDFDYGPGNRYWHTPQDVPANTSAESLDVVGEVIAELVYRGG